MSTDLLPSWRDGATRDAVLAFLDAAGAVPVEQRVATLDNDGTLWCERPTYAQFDFFADALATRAADDSSLTSRPEYAAVLDGDASAIAEIGLPRVAVALAELFAGKEPHEFTLLAREFMARARHRTRGVPLAQMVYQPMLELLDALRHHEFSVFIVTGGGTEFVRAISQDLYGVPPESVVGTLIEYEYSRDGAGRPRLRRTSTMGSEANEGAAKVAHIQTQLGRRPIFAAGNSAGDREMMEWACATDLPSLAVLVDHDDPVREFQYTSLAATFEEDEPITTVAAGLGWTVVSMANDWSSVFPGEDPSSHQDDARFR